MRDKAYKNLFLVVAIHSLVMFSLTYLAVFEFSHLTFSLNKFYMTIAMVSPMVFLMLLYMNKMFKIKKINVLIFLSSIFFFIFAVLAVRSQLFLNNENFLNSMIPHHSSAILMCERSNITDKEIKDLCEEIVKTQKDEIEKMKNISERF